MYVTERQTSYRQTDVRQKHRLMPLPIRGGEIIIEQDITVRRGCCFLWKVWFVRGPDDVAAVGMTRDELLTIAAERQTLQLLQHQQQHRINTTYITRLSRDADKHTSLFYSLQQCPITPGHPKDNIWTLLKQYL